MATIFPTSSIQRWVISLLVPLLSISNVGWFSVRSAFGDEGPPDAAHAFLIDTMTVTATRGEHPPFDVTRAVTVVTSGELARRQPAVLPDLLRGETGVSVQETTPGQGSPIIRGMIGSSILMLVNGMRLNNALFRPAPNQYFALVDPYNVERIEVVRGEASTLFGSDALGGVVQVLTPVPRFETETWRARGILLGAFRSADLGGVSRLCLEGGTKRLGARAGFTYETHSDLYGGRDAGVQHPSAYSLVAGDGALFLDHGQQDLWFDVQYLQQPQTPRYDTMTTGYGQSHPSDAVYYYEPNDRLFAHGRYGVDRPLSFLDRLEFHLAFQRVRDDRRIREFESAEEVHEQNTSDLAGMTLQFQSVRGRWLCLSYGAELYHDSVGSARTGTDILTGAISRPRGRFADGSTMWQLGLYLQDEVSLTDRLRAVMGIRYSYVGVRLPGTPELPGTDLGLHDLTGSLGLAYRVLPGVNLVANAGRGFRAPNIFDLSTLGPRPGNRFHVPNPDLGPEQAVSCDTGVKIVRPRFTAELFGFWTLFLDKIEAVRTGDQTAEGREIVQSRNLSRVTYAGAEAAGRIRLLEPLELQANVTYTWAEETLPDGQRFPASRIPPVNGRICLLYRPLPTLWIEPFLRFAGPQDRLSPQDEADPRINPEGTPGWVSVNIGAGWSPHKRVELGLTVENLLDTTYREHGSGIDAPGIDAMVQVELHCE